MNLAISSRRFALFIFTALVSFTSFSQDLPSAYINVSGTRVYVEGGGNGKGIPMIFVHAGFQDHAMWFEQTRDFMKDHVVITLDLPGHGKTKDGPERPLGADVIKVVMDSLQMPKATIIGLSLGAAVVTDFAIAHPARVNNLVLASSGLNGWDEGRELDTITKQYIKELTTALETKDTSVAAEVFTHYWFDGITRSDKTVSPVLRELVKTTTRNTMRQHQGFTSWPKFAEPAAIHNLSRLQAPTLLLTGTLDLPEVLVMNGYLFNNLPNAKQVMISGTAHMINMEKPERFNEEIRKFLNAKP